MAHRQEVHLKANADRKLTPGERKVRGLSAKPSSWLEQEKTIKKLMKDTRYRNLATSDANLTVSVSVNVCVFRVRDLSHRKLSFKVEKNAKQLYLTGCAVVAPDMSCVIVEGNTVCTVFLSYCPQATRMASTDTSD